MVKFTIPRHEINVRWDDKENAECPLNDALVHAKRGESYACFYFDKETYPCDGGDALDSHDLEMTYEELATNMKGLTRPLFVSRDNRADLSTQFSSTYNTFVGVVNFENGHEDDWDAFNRAIIQALKDYRAWGNNEIIGCDVYRITPQGKEYVTCKCGWYLEDLEDMVCTADGELNTTGYIAVNIPNDMGVE